MRRVVSLLPSITELVCEIGAGPSLVAVTHECDYPVEVVATLPRATTADINPHLLSQEEVHRQVCESLTQAHSLYGLDSTVLRDINPTHIFTQALCHVCSPTLEQVKGMCASLFNTKGQPVIVSLTPKSLVDVADCFALLGSHLDLRAEAEQRAQIFHDGLDTIRRAVSSTSEARPKVAFLEWLEPLFDGGHWIPDMLQIAGAHYSLNASGYYSKQMSVPRLEAYDPDIIIIAPCGFDLARAVVDAKAMWRHSWWRRLRAVISMQVYVCDGNAFFARPGPRLVQGTAILAKILHKNIELPRALLSPGSFRQL